MGVVGFFLGGGVSLRQTDKNKEHRQVKYMGGGGKRSENERARENVEKRKFYPFLGVTKREKRREGEKGEKYSKSSKSSSHTLSACEGILRQ